MDVFSEVSRQHYPENMPTPDLGKSRDVQYHDVVLGRLLHTVVVLALLSQQCSLGFVTESTHKVYEMHGTMSLLIQTTCCYDVLIRNYMH